MRKNRIIKELIENAKNVLSKS
ncbi:hypothetical protein BAPKO_3544 (plasmid) [Borreliella afzelii PKo]|nr:hypothetical protein BAPKO_3544 [Borreliella afzelii PKo]